MIPGPEGWERTRTTDIGDYAVWGMRMSEPTGVPAGWYPNPENPAQQRYWDGQQWSAHTADATAGTPTTPGQSLAAPSTGTPPAKKAIWKRWWFITAAAVVLILVIAGIASGGGNKKNNNKAASTPSSNTTTSEIPTASKTPTPTPTPTPKPTPVAPKAVRYAGHGDKLVKIAKPASGANLVTIVGYGSSSNFVVESLDSSLQEVDLLVNVIGSYSGTVLMDVQEGQETARLKITYPGTWTVVLRPISAAPEFKTTAAGTGDRVFKYLGEAQGLRITNRGSDNFVVQTCGDDGDLLVNEIGNYSGEVVLGAGPELIQIQSDGHWTLRTTG
jgi:hypothetical protein